MAKAKRTGNSFKGYYASYKSGKIWERNRLRKLRRALKRNPENAEQINAAMAGVGYRRGTPKTKVWSATMVKTAALFKAFQGYVPKVALSSAGPKKGEEQEYWTEMNKVGFALTKVKPGTGSMFSLGERAFTRSLA